MTKKIGLLLPRSVIYPTMSFDMLNGLKASLAHADMSDMEIKTEATGIGGDDKLIYTACEKLLMDGASIVLGYINPTSAAKLQPLFEGAGAILIALDAGYHFPVQHEPQSHVFTVGLEGSLCCRATARMAAADGYKGVAFTGSFYDAGYRSALAFTGALTDAGSNVTFNHITQLKRSEFTLAPLAAHIQSHKGEAIFASFCGDMAQDFYAAAAQDPTFATAAIYGSPFMAEELWLAQSRYAGSDIKAIVPWASTLDTAVNKDLTAALSAKKQKINIWSMLTWDAAKVVAVALSEDDANAAIAKLEGLSYQSPRGEASIDAQTHRSAAPIYEAKVTLNEATGNCAIKIGNSYAHTVEERLKLDVIMDSFDGQATSWFNAYACLDS